MSDAATGKVDRLMIVILSRLCSDEQTIVSLNNVGPLAKFLE